MIIVLRAAFSKFDLDFRLMRNDLFEGRTPLIPQKSLDYYNSEFLADDM